MKRLAIIFFMLVFAIFGCKKAGNKSDQYESEFNESLIPVRFDKFFHLTKINLESSPKSLVSFPYDITTLGSEIYISSRDVPIKVFDRTGKFLRTIGNIGDGPGEYRWVDCIFPIPPDKIGIYGFPSRSLSVFKSNGDFVGSKRLPFAPGRRVVVYYKNHYYIQVPYTPEYRCNVIELTDSFEVSGTYFPAQSGFEAYTGTGMFHGGLFVDTTDGCLYEMDSFSENVIRKLDLHSKKTSYISLGKPSFFTPIPPLRRAPNYQEAQESFNKGTDVLNLYLLESRFFVVHYIISEGPMRIIKSVVYDLKHHKSYLIEGGFGATYCDGRHLYELIFVEHNNEDLRHPVNPILIIYDVNEEFRK
ncbi:MAG: 6-bladed beta-propeller [Bacteroidota bacterium]